MSRSRGSFPGPFPDRSGPVPEVVPAIGNDEPHFDPPRERVPEIVPDRSGSVPAAERCVPGSPSGVDRSPPYRGERERRADRTVSDLLDRVTALGVEIRVEGEQIRLRPMGLVPADMLAALRVAKPQVLAVLRGEPEPTATPATGGGIYAPDGDRCSGCDAPLGLQGRIVRLAAANSDGTLTCLDCIRGETEKRRMRARGVAI